MNGAHIYIHTRSFTRIVYTIGLYVSASIWKIGSFFLVRPSRISSENATLLSVSLSCISCYMMRFCIPHMYIYIIHIVEEGKGKEALYNITVYVCLKGSRMRGLSLRCTSKFSPRFPTPDENRFIEIKCMNWQTSVNFVQTSSSNSTQVAASQFPTKVSRDGMCDCTYAIPKFQPIILWTIRATEAIKSTARIHLSYCNERHQFSSMLIEL